MPISIRRRDEKLLSEYLERKGYAQFGSCFAGVLDGRYNDIRGIIKNQINIARLRFLNVSYTKEGDTAPITRKNNDAAIRRIVEAKDES